MAMAFENLDDAIVEVGRRYKAKKRKHDGDFLLRHYSKDFTWVAEIGTASPYGLLRELEGEFVGEGASPLEAVLNLIDEL